MHIPAFEKINPGHYIKAILEGQKKLLGRNPEEAAAAAGAAYLPGEGTFVLTCYGHSFSVHPGQGWVHFAKTMLVPPIDLQVMIWHYLATADGSPLATEWLPYRLLPDGQVFDKAFRQLAIDPAGAFLKEKGRGGIAAATPFGGEEASGKGDINILFQAFPRVPVLYSFWEGDDEVDAALTILFDQSAPHYLHTEDLAVVGIFATSMLTERISRS